MGYQRIRDLREDSDKTQKQVAEDMHLHLTQYHRYETGESEIPLSFAISLAKYYNVSIDYIAGLTNEKTSVNTNDISLSDLKFLIRFRQLSEIQKGRILERIDMITEKNIWSPYPKKDRGIFLPQKFYKSIAYYKVLWYD